MNKYNAKKTEYNGTIYHSRKEASFAKDLDVLLRAKEIKGYERQYPVPLVVNGRKIATYIIDFVVTNKDDSAHYIDVKGMETPLFRIKKKLFEALTGNTLEIVK